MNKSFTLIEVLAAILVIIIGVLAAYAVVQKILSYTSESSHRLTAVYLAQEEIEGVRNIRDSNWLDGTVPWNNGLTASSTGWGASSLDGYQRKIDFDNSTADRLGVMVSIQWTDKGQTRTITVQENLYNWK